MSARPRPRGDRLGGWITRDDLWHRIRQERENGASRTTPPQPDADAPVTPHEESDNEK